MAFVVNPQSGDADILRIVEYPYRGGSPVTLLDLNDGINYSLVGGTFKFTPPERQQHFAMSQRRYGGGLLAQETHGNATVSAEWYVRGTTATQANEYAEVLLAHLERIEDHVGSLYLAWQPSGASYPVMFQLRAAAAWEPQYRWIEYAQTKTLHIAAGVQVAPLAEGLPMFISDTFAIDSSADYETFIGSDADWTITGGAVKLNSIDNDVVLFHKDRGYTVGDCSYLINARPGNTTSNQRFGTLFRVVDSQNHVRSSLRLTATNTVIQIESVEAGVTTVRTASGMGAPIPPNTEFWYRTWNEGPRIYAAVWIDGKKPEDTPSHQGVWTPADPQVLTFGRGIYNKPAIFLRSSHSGDRLLSWECRPFRYQAGSGAAPGSTIPDPTSLDGPIPGSAPAKVDAEFYVNAVSEQPVWGMLGWSSNFNPFNMLLNGYFEEDADGWSTGATAGGLHVAGTSLSRWQDLPYPAGSDWHGTVVLPATLNAGAHYKIYRQFERGKTYSLTMLVRSDSGNASVSAGVGSGTSSFASSGTVVVGDSSWTTLTASWTPTGNVSEAFVYLRSEAATAYNLHFGNVRLYGPIPAGTAATVEASKGALPPFGRIKAMLRDASGSTGWVTPIEGQTDGYLDSSSANPVWETIIDPSLLAHDPFSGQEIQLELWAKVAVSSAPTIAAASVIPFSRIGTARYTNEYGRLGKTIPNSAGILWKYVRLGTIPVLSNKGNPSRYRLRIAFNPATATTPSISLSDIYITQPTRRALGPTGKTNNDDYPRFLPGTSAKKRIYHDLSAESTSLRGSYFPDHGLGGAFLEIDPGTNNRVFVLVADHVPENPEGDIQVADVTQLGMVFDVTPRWFYVRS